MKHVDIYTDGACKGNPGPGGYGAILVYGGQERELSGGGRLGDLVGDEGMEERTCLYLSLGDAVRSLPERDRQVLALRFSRGLAR